MSDKIKDTRWAHRRTGHVLHITGTNASRSLHQYVDESSAYSGVILDADLRADFEQVGTDAQPGDVVAPTPHEAPADAVLTPEQQDADDEGGDDDGDETDG